MEHNKVTVECDGRPAQVEMLGEGPDVVFVGTAAPMMWTRGSAEHLARNGYRVTNFDYGAGWDQPLPKTALEQVDDVEVVMDALAVESAAVVGLSRGAMTAFGLAVKHSSRVDSLVLAFPVAGYEDTMMIADPDPEPTAGESQESFMKKMLETIFSEDYLDTHFEVALALVTTPPGSVVRVDRSEETTFSPRWSVTVPTLVVEGGADRIVKAEHPRRYLDAIEGAHHALIPDAPHGWLMEQPGEFARIVADFLG